jgi:hypothetical protein
MMLDFIEQYNAEEVKRMAQLFLPGYYLMNRCPACVDTNGLGYCCSNRFLIILALL